MWIDDQIIEKCHEAFHIELFLPAKPCVVLGSSNKKELEVNEENCAVDGIDVLKRYGGGGTVVLYKDSLVVSVGCWVKSIYDNDKYFRLMNETIISCLTDLRPAVKFSQRGYSDIVVGEKKIAGTSLFRSRKYMLYQASVLIDLDIELVNRALRHPTKEPDYRKGRSHSDFLSDLKSFGFDQGSQSILQHFRENYQRHFVKILNSEFSEPMSEHIPHLLKRIARGK